MFCRLASDASLDRTRLVHDHLALVSRVARSIHVRCREHVDLDELVALGNVGLVEAATRFDPDAGVTFRTFAHYRIQGAILDGLRRATTLPRREWRRLNALRSAIDELEHRSLVGGTPQLERERAQTIAELREALAAIRTVYLRSIEDSDHRELAAAEGTDARRDREDSMPGIDAAVAALPTREQHVVRQHYWEGRTLKDIGADFGVTKGTASRIHANAVARLRGCVGPDGELLAAATDACAVAR